MKILLDEKSTIKEGVIEEGREQVGRKRGGWKEREMGGKGGS